MPKTKESPRRPLAPRVATGGTAFASLVFLVVGAGALLQHNGLFSAGIALMLILYAGMLGWIARASQLGSQLANGAIVASSLLHVMVAVSTARGSHQWWLWPFAALALVTLLAALKIHLEDLKQAQAGE